MFCAQCGNPVGAAGGEGSKCLCREPLVLEEVADATELELDWGARDPRDEAQRAPSDEAGVRPQAAPHEPPPAPEPVASATLTFVPTAPVSAMLDFAAKASAFVLTVATLLEVASILVALMGLVLNWFGAAGGFDWMPAQSRVAAWVLSIGAVALWTFQVLRARHGRGGPPAGEEFQALLLTPVSPARGVAVFKELFPDVRRGTLALGLQGAALLAAVCWLTLVPRLHSHGAVPFVVQIVVAAVICAALVTTREVLIEVQRYEAARAAEQPVVTPEPAAQRPAVVAAAPPAPRAVPASHAAAPRPAVSAPARVASAPPQPAPASAVVAEVPQPSAPPKLEKCLHCGSPIDEKGADCPECKAPQLFDVVLLTAVANPRIAHAAATALSKLGPLAPSFSEARARLTSPSRAIVAAAPRAFAMQVVEVLKSNSVSARLVRVRGSRLRLPSMRAVAAAAAAAVVLAAGAYWKTRTLSTVELAERAKPSIVTVKCSGWSGTGFFVTPQLIVTNEHVACRDGEKPQIIFAEGRKTVGTVRGTDSWLDLAIIDVPGANEKALPLGDAGSVREGAHVLMIGSPAGLDFTVNQAMVSHVGRTDLGIAYLQFDGNVNHGNSGGPLLDDRGNVIGVVTMRFEEMQGIGLAVPINYLGEASMEHAGVPVPASSPGWAKLKALAQEEDRKQLAAVEQQLEHPVLLDVALRGGTLEVAVGVRSPSASPPSVTLTARTDNGSGTPCDEPLEVSRWSRVTLTDVRLPQRLRWMADHNLIEGLFTGTSTITTHCARARGELTILDGSRLLARLPLQP